MYKVFILKSTLKQLSKLPKKESLWLTKEIYKLGENPRPSGHKKLKASTDKYRIRVGDYRAIYTIDDGVLVVEVITVAHRKQAYKKK